jgi:hypothetical protein
MLATQKQCVICHAPVAAMLDKVCASPTCRLKHMAENLQAQERKRRAALEQQANTLRERGASALGIAEPGTFPLTIIPSFTATVTNLPERRRRAFRDHLNRLLSQATDQSHVEKPDAGPPPRKPLPLAVQTALGGACTACKGCCCSQAGDKAYLKVKTLRRYLTAHPELRPRDVLAAYLDRLPRKSMQGSCIFHGPEGCTLSREMRSDTCNDYLCSELRRFPLDKSRTEPIRAFFVAEQQGSIKGGMFVGEDGYQPVAVPAAT